MMAYLIYDLFNLPLFNLTLCNDDYRVKFLHSTFSNSNIDYAGAINDIIFSIFIPCFKCIKNDISFVTFMFMSLSSVFLLFHFSFKYSCF